MKIKYILMAACCWVTSASAEPAAKYCANNDAGCQSFILGFLNGALLTDKAIVTSYETSQRSSFKDRALRTRLSKRDTPVTQRAGFCLPSEGDLGQIAAQLAQKISPDDSEAKALSERVYVTVKESYPCPEVK